MLREGGYQAGRLFPFYYSQTCSHSQGQANCCQMGDGFVINSDNKYLYAGKDITHVEDTYANIIEKSVNAKSWNVDKQSKAKRKGGRIVRMSKRPPKVTGTKRTII